MESQYGSGIPAINQHKEQKRPRGITHTAIVFCVHNLLGYSMIDWDDENALGMAILLTPVIVLTFPVIWFFWKGRNWARWLVLLTCFVGLWNITTIPSWSPYLRGFLTVEALLSLFLLYWLNVPKVRAWFSASSTESTTPNSPTWVISVACAVALSGAAV
jgi:hypothetical protein